VYENLMGNPEFGRFLGILKDFQQEAYQQALSRPEEANFYLGGADIINAVKTDIEAILGNGPAVF